MLSLSWCHIVWIDMTFTGWLLTDQRDGSPITPSTCCNQWRLWPSIAWQLIFVTFQIMVMPELAILGQKEKIFISSNDKGNNDCYFLELWVLLDGALRMVEWGRPGREGCIMTVRRLEFKNQSSIISNKFCFPLMM